MKCSEQRWVLLCSYVFQDCREGSQFRNLMGCKVGWTLGYGHLMRSGIIGLGWEAVFLQKRKDAAEKKGCNNPLVESVWESRVLYSLLQNEICRTLEPWSSMLFSYISNCFDYYFCCLVEKLHQEDLKASSTGQSSG